MAHSPVPGFTSNWEGALLRPTLQPLTVFGYSTPRIVYPHVLDLATPLTQLGYRISSNTSRASNISRDGVVVYILVKSDRYALSARH